VLLFRLKGLSPCTTAACAETHRSDLYDRRVSESRRVYSTAAGDLRKATGRREAPPVPNDGVVRVSRETSGRRGKTVTVVRGIPPRDVASVASDLKRQCGSGGSAKDGVVELQGDHRANVVHRLEAQGYRVKLAGG
jgi:translation initiation factor 1